MKVQLQDQSVRLRLDEAELARPAVEALAGRLPCRDGLPFEIALEDGSQLQLQFDVDVRDSVRQRGVTRRSTASSV